MSQFGTVKARSPRTLLCWCYLYQITFLCVCVGLTSRCRGEEKNNILRLFLASLMSGVLRNNTRGVWGGQIKKGLFKILVSLSWLTPVVRCQPSTRPKNWVPPTQGWVPFVSAPTSPAGTAMEVLCDTLHHHCPFTWVSHLLGWELKDQAASYRL